MGFGDMFGFGKKQKAPFKIPGKISELRIRIETEGRERYPGLARYEEIMKEAELVYRYLDDIIAKKEYAAEAMRIRGDISNKLAVLREKIKVNAQEAQKEGRPDYVEKNIDYLERKSMRNNAKTVFTEFLEEFESFELYCKEGRLESDKSIESVTEKIFKTLSKLNNDFIKIYGKDMEIQVLKEKLLLKMSDMNALFKKNNSRFIEKGLEARIESQVKQILGETK